ncbi:MAG: thioredoxin [Actinomycetota bacterium]
MGMEPGPAVFHRRTHTNNRSTSRMATVELTKDNFEATITSNEIVVVDFWADWCGPCKRFAPVFEKVSERHADIVFAKMDTEAQPELAQTFGIMSIPTLAVFRENVLLFSQPGALPDEALEDILGQVRELDMDDVRAQLHDHDHDHAGHDHAGHDHTH